MLLNFTCPASLSFNLTSALFRKRLIQFPLSMLKQEAYFRVLWGVLFFQHTSSDLGNMLGIESSEGQEANQVLLWPHLSENKNNVK